MLKGNRNTLRNLWRRWTRKTTTPDPWDAWDPWVYPGTWPPPHTRKPRPLTAEPTIPPRLRLLSGPTPPWAKNRDGDGTTGGAS